MRREKYFYNEQTLQYEKIKLTPKQLMLRVLSYTCAIAFAGFLFGFTLWQVFPGIFSKTLADENYRLKGVIAEMTDKNEQFSEALSSMQERDRRIYRMVLEMDPIDESVWEGGVGGSATYPELRDFGNSGDMMADLKQKSDKLKRQLVLQSLSLEKIEKMAEDKETMLASIPSMKPIRSDNLNRRVELLSGFGYRLHPIHKVRKMHAGIDFSARKGTPIQATGDGRVLKVLKKKSGYGLHVIIDHGYGYQTLYGHMSKVDVKVGERIKRGQVIGKVGSTGTSTAPHCHYEVHYKGKAVNPIDYVLDGLTPAEYQELVHLAELDNQSFD